MTTKQKQLLESYIEKQVRKHLDEKRMVYHAEASAIYGAIRDIENESGIFPEDITKKIKKMLNQIEKYNDKYGVYDADEYENDLKNYKTKPTN